MTLPQGLLYHPAFISTDEEITLLNEIHRLDFSEIRMHGVTAKRRVVHLGWIYGYDSWRINPGPPIPAWLGTLRARAASLIEAAEDGLAEALITQYPPGAGIGWHRDAPAFGVIIAISLAGTCRLRFQRGEKAERETAELIVEPRSVYVLRGPARSEWQHSVPAAKELRYSITFRTLRTQRT